MKHLIFLAIQLVCFGVILITAAFFVPPMGVIYPTVLTAFGEILTFAGAVIGIDYKHRSASPSHHTLFASYLSSFSSIALYFLIRRRFRL